MSIDIHCDNIVVGTALYERGRTVPMGEWIEVPFNPADFSAGTGMTWTVPAGSVKSNSYTLIGKTLVWNVLIGPTTLAGSPASTIVIAIPTGFTTARQVQIVGQINLAGVWQPALVAHAPGGSAVNIYKVDLSPMALGEMHLTFQIVFTLA